MAKPCHLAQCQQSPSQFAGCLGPPDLRAGANIPRCGSSLSRPGQSFSARTFSSAFHPALGTPLTILAPSSLPEPQTTHRGCYDSLVKLKTDTLGWGSEKNDLNPLCFCHQPFSPCPQHKPTHCTDIRLPCHQLGTD